MVEALLLAFALSVDAFSIALGVGASFRDAASRLRLSVSFGAFQFAMPIIGWQAGAQILPAITPWDRFVAAGLLVAIAAKMLWESFKSQEHERDKTRGNPTKGWTLIVLSIATSIDALAAGVALEQFAGYELVTCAAIGVVTFGMTNLAMVLGNRAAARFGDVAERVGALVLVGIAIKVAVT